MKNITWQELLVKFGFAQTADKKNTVTLRLEKNAEFLDELLQASGVVFRRNGKTFDLTSAPASEHRFAEEFESRKLSSGTAMYPDQLEVRYLDPYVAGLVVQLNRLGLNTLFSCDGHGIRRGNLCMIGQEEALQAFHLIRAHGVLVRRRFKTLTFQENREALLELSLQLSRLSPEEAGKLIDEKNTIVQKEKFEDRLEQLLTISGDSGNEERIRNVVFAELAPCMDRIAIDHAGNIIAQKRFGSGPVVLLNAHLDTVEPFLAGREIIKGGPVWSSSEGILGADDHAGIAVILSVAETLDKMEESNFRGTLKVIFTVEEEIGLVGARLVEESFLWDVDMAFVADRRGTSDIVTSNRGIRPFCSESFGRALEQTVRMAGMGEWKLTPGGSSDTAVWASHGIDSVNLSVGYRHEHTDWETLDTDACYRTYRLLLTFVEEAAPIQRRCARLAERTDRDDSNAG